MGLRSMPAIVTTDDIRATYRRPRTYPLDRALDRRIMQIEERGLLPLTYTHPAFLDMNILAAWVNWSGSISASPIPHEEPNDVRGRPIRPVSTVHIGMTIPKDLQADLDGMLTRYDFTTNTANGGNKIRLGNLGSTIGRILLFMADHVSMAGDGDGYDKKSHHPLDLPGYLLDLLEQPTPHKIGERSMRRKALQDYATVAWWSKLGGMNGNELRLRHQPTEESARHLVLRTARLMNEAYGFGFGEKEMHVWPTRIPNSERIAYTAYLAVRPHHRDIAWERGILDRREGGLVPSGRYAKLVTG